MSTPEENFEIAAGESDGEKSREEAISELEVANECDMLADLVRDDDLDEEVHRQAIEALATPQCDQILESIIDEGELDESLQDEAQQLLDEAEDSGRKFQQGQG